MARELTRGRSRTASLRPAHGAVTMACMKSKPALTFAQLECLCAVAEAGSFTGAAAAMHVAQSSLSRTFAEIERTAGVPLVERKPRGVVFTAAGTELVAVARELVTSRDAAMRRFRRFLAGERGSIRLATLASLWSGFLPPLIRRLRSAVPDLHIAIKDGLPTDIIRAVASGDADLGLTDHGPLPDHLTSEPLLSDRMFLVMPAGHRLAGHAEIGWTEQAREDLIALPPGSSERPLLEAGLREAGIDARPVFEASQLVTVAGLVDAGLGVCPLPQLATVSVTAAAGIIARPLVAPVVHRHIAVVSREDRTLQPVAEAVLHTLREHAPDAAPAT